MPELPDLTVVAEAFHAALAGRPIDVGRRRPGRSPCAARRPSWRPSSASASTSIRRRGKFLLVDLDRDRIVVNPMLTGRFQLAAPDDKQPTKTAVVLGFGARATGRRRDAARMDAGAAWMPGGRRDAAEVRYRDPTQMGKVYLLPAGVERPIPGMADGELGPDADDPDADPRGLARADPASSGRAEEPAAQPGVRRRDRQRLQRRDPARGAAAAVPQAVEPRLRGDRRALRGDARRRSPTAIEVLRERVPPTFETQVRDFLAVHNKGGQPCPRCGTRITRGQGRRLHHLVLPGLPALRPARTRARRAA